MEFFSFVKRKSKLSSSSSDQSSKETNSPESKRLKEREDDLHCHEALAVECSAASSEGKNDVVLSVLDMAEDFASKVDLIFSKLVKLDQIATEIQSLRESVERINLTIKSLQQDCVRVEQDLRKVSTTTNNLQQSVESLNKDVREDKAKMGEIITKNEEELKILRLQLLDYEVYQRRENLRFYGIREDREEDTKEVLYNFLENNLGISNARKIEIQRVHRTGRRPNNGKPRGIIARVLRYSDREDIFARRSALSRESDFGIGPDLPKQVVDMRKKLIPKMIEARKRGKRAAFSRSQPYILFVDGEKFS